MKETVVAQEEKEEEEVGIYTPFPFPLKNMLCLARKICTILIMRKTWEKSKSNELLTKNLKRKVGGISIRLLRNLKVFVQLSPVFLFLVAMMNCSKLA